MLLLRYIDQRGQQVLGIISIISIPVLLYFGFLFGLLIMAPWQLLSASLNTIAFIRNGYKKQIITYWKWSIITLSLVLLLVFFSRSGYGDDMLVGWWLIIPMSVVIAIYYMRIYNNLIVHLKLRKELSGLLKS